MQENLEFQEIEDDSNPIDSVEEVLAANNWSFERTHNDELIVEVTGKSSTYRLFFIWQEGMNALQFGCHYDIAIGSNNLDEAYKTIISMNQKLWMGHFDLPQETQTPIFRYTCMLRGAARASMAEAIEDMVDISLMQCERYYPAFHLLANENSAPTNPQHMSLALMETVGES
jgi:hypothetical protein